MLDDGHRIVTGEFGLSYAPIDRFNISAEMVGDYVSGHFNTAFGGGFNLRGRMELLKIRTTCVFLDVSAGLLENDHDIPEGGTHFNFTESLGFGAYLPIAADVWLLFGARFQHLSNADISVNPGYNGLQAYVGLAIPL